MAFTELSRLVERLRRGRPSTDERESLTGELAAVRDVLLRLGAHEPAAQLDLAADLLQGGNPEADLERMVLALVVPIEQKFHLAPATERKGGASAPGPRAKLRVKLGIARDMLLGEMLVHFGVIGAEQLASALAVRPDSRRRLGEILVEQGATSVEEIERALAYQARLRGEGEPAPATPARRSERRAPTPPLTAPKSDEAPTPASTPMRLRMARDLLLGEILVLQGALSRPNLARALEQQRRRGCLLGETLLELKLVSRRQLEAALTFQGRGRRSPAARRAA